MNPEQPGAAPPAATDQPSELDPELMRLYHETKRTYRALMLNDEIDNKFMILKKTYAKHEPNSVNPPMIINDVKDHKNNLLNIR